MSAVNKKELEKTIAKMKLSEIKSRLFEINNLFNSNDDKVIDELIPLSEEAKLLKVESDKRMGSIENYLSE